MQPTSIYTKTCRRCGQALREIDDRCYVCGEWQIQRPKPDRTWLSRAAFWTLAFFTVVSLYHLTYLHKPVEENAIAAGIGSIGTCGLAPYWILYRRRIPLVVILLALPALIYGIILANMAMWKGEGPPYEDYSTPGHYIWDWTLPIPGLIYVLARKYLPRLLRHFEYPDSRS